MHPRPNFTSCAVFLRGRRESDKTDDEKYSAMPHTKTTDKLFIIEPQTARNKSHGEIIRICIGIFTTALRNEKSNQIFNENTSLYFHSALLVI